jgi:hypothetical protein
MSVALGATWNPRGELARFQRLLPDLQKVYSGITISFPPQADQEAVVQVLEDEGIQAVVNPEWSWGRRSALDAALKTGAAHVQYADFDRLLRWAETRPEEWRRVAAEIERHDCLVIGRTQAAYSTHPQALIQTEAISNRVVSTLLGKPVDASAGSKGFSSRAAEFLLANTRPERALGTDAEWPVLLKRAGFAVDTIEVDGLDWESADRYRPSPASAEDQARAARAYDADPRHWEYRVGVAMEIVQSGLDAMERELIYPNEAE